MKTFFLIIGLLSTLSRCSEIAQRLAFNGHESDIYLVDNEKSADDFRNGISYMFQKINEEVAIHALCHFQQNNFAANFTKNQLQNAIQSKLSKNGAKTKVNWKAFLEEELKNIEKRLMKPGLSNEQLVSKASLAIVIVDGNTVTQAQIGDTRIVSFAKDSQQSKTGLRVKESAPAKLKNKIGGQFFKKKDSTIRGDADVTDLSDVRYIIIATRYFWFVNAETVTQILLQNENNLKTAAFEVTKLIQIPKYEANNGIIIIGLNPSATILAPKRENEQISIKDKEFAPVSTKSKNDGKMKVPARNRNKSRLSD